jgi:hypothetical protein
MGSTWDQQHGIMGSHTWDQQHVINNMGSTWDQQHGIMGSHTWDQQHGINNMGSTWDQQHMGSSSEINSKRATGTFVCSFCINASSFITSSIPTRIHRTAGGGFYTCADTKHKKDNNLTFSALASKN